jgi:hypothetical protein
VRRVETERRRRACRFGRSGRWRRRESATRRLLLIRCTALWRLVMRRQEEVWHRGARVGGVLIRSAVSVRDRLVIRVRRLHVLRLVVRVLRWCGWRERRRQRVRVVAAVVLARGRVSRRRGTEVGRPPERRTVRVAVVLILVERWSVPECCSSGSRETAVGWVLQVSSGGVGRTVHCRWRVPAVVSVRVLLLLHVRGAVHGLSGVRVVKVALRSDGVSFSRCLHRASLSRCDSHSPPRRNRVAVVETAGAAAVEQSRI